MRYGPFQRQNIASPSYLDNFPACADWHLKMPEPTNNALIEFVANKPDGEHKRAFLVVLNSAKRCWIITDVDARHGGIGSDDNPGIFWGSLALWVDVVHLVLVSMRAAQVFQVND